MQSACKDVADSCFQVEIRIRNKYKSAVHYQDFPTHPHYHGPGMTYFWGGTHRSALWGPQPISQRGLCSGGGGGNSGSQAFQNRETPRAPVKKVNAVPETTKSVFQS